MENEKGRRVLGSGCVFIDDEAICEDSDKENVEEEDVNEEEGDYDFVDNASVNEGNHLLLFQTQQKKAGEDNIVAIKRKLQLSPCSQEEAVSPTHKNNVAQNRKYLVKRRLFDSVRPVAGSDEARRPLENVLQVQNGENQEKSPCNTVFQSGSGEEAMHLQVLRSKNMAACKLRLFKLLYVASYCDLTRVFKSNKTCNVQWVIAGFGVTEVMYEASFELLKKACTYLQTSRKIHESGSVALYFCVFKVAKSRDTVEKLFSKMINVDPLCLMIQPPKIRGTCAALFWVKNGMSPATFKYGETPQWILTQTMISENVAEATKFDFGQMVQWAYDLGYTDESKIAYEYACCADTDCNARAFLAANNQPKIVKDVSTMVRLYQRAEIQRMSMSEYIHSRCKHAGTGGTWNSIMALFKLQGIEPIRFVNALRTWLKGVPKQNCIAFIGPPNSGKSMLCNSFISFMGGKVLTFANHHSHFWLQPLSDARVALIDDATETCWKYFDTYLRNVLDGYEVSIDRKHKSAIQMKAPPLLVTSNIDVHSLEKYYYLHSRIVPFYFKETLPTSESGEPLLFINDADWSVFFARLWGRLDLSDQEEEEEEGDEDGKSATAFRCSSRKANGAD
ncbi:E1 protein [Okapia johnstoni papillomavirus 1]|uniref:Replication protein E1 n=1 Tax=Okapia johnstoni papillomavirus 1 TaxID=2304449 RepID=A0A346LUY3_9PAPI|nr:E1 protein [Okapia johnstoni papillomavirus 1]